MIAHYLTMAFASFRRAPFATAANVVTLALGLACFIAAYGIATYWRSADWYHQDAGRLFVVGQSIVPAAEPPTDFVVNVSTPALARYLTIDAPEVEIAARAMALSDGSEVAVTAGDRQMFLHQANVDPAFLELFEFDFLAGDVRALDDPNGVVLTQATADRLFGDEPALGRTIFLSGMAERTVTGVIAPVRQPSFMGDGADAVVRFDFLGTWSSSFLGSMWDAQESWAMNAAYTFVRLAPGASLDNFDASLQALAERRVPADQLIGQRLVLRSYPVSEITTRLLDNLLFGRSGLGLSTIGVLLGLGLLTLAVAGLNYASLATAQAVIRGKEIGMRKVLGAGRVQVMLQAWVEALVLTVTALAAALAVLALAVPVARALTGVDILYFLSAGVSPLAVLAGIVLFTALLAGAYPALDLSRLRPAAALGSGSRRSGGRLLTQLLVGLQFASAGFLLILVVVTQLQRAELERVVLDAREDPIALLGTIGTRVIGVDQDTFRNRLLQHPGIKSVSVTDHGPFGIGGIQGVRLARSADSEAAGFNGFYKNVDHDYFATLNLDVLAGRVFERGRDTVPADVYSAADGQTPAVVIDRVFAERLGFPTPQAAVDQVVYVPEELMGGRAAQAVHIVGVTDAETTQLQASLNLSGTLYAFAPASPRGGQYPLIRMDRHDVAGAVAGIRQVWDELAPRSPLQIRFFDEMFEQSYRRYARVGQLFTVLACSAFIIATIGLIGMAVHATGRRRHEIGVRKTLGSTMPGVVRLLLLDFSRPILIANLLAWPLGYIAAQAYLSAFTHRIELTPAPFAMSLSITFVIAWAAVIGEVLRAASVRPAEVLRHA